MRRISNVLAAAVMVAVGVRHGAGQVISPPEIRDPEMRDLQQKHLADLKAVATGISSHSFPYRLYFGRTLDLDETEQPRRDQRSIRFDKFRTLTVVEITANYYAAYSAALMQKGDRARRTLDDVIVPMLEAAIPPTISDEKVQGFAIEISHHVRKKVLGVSTENPENVAFILPRKAAERLMAATTDGEREAALMEGMLFVDREQLDGWGPRIGETFAKAETAPAPAPSRVDAKPTLNAEAFEAIVPPVAVEREKPVAPVVAAAQAEAPPERISKLQNAYRETLDRLVRELDQEAHFISYAPPAFIPFHKGAYLQLSIVTTLQEKEGGSQYRVAALAFDEHIAHLIRPVLASVKTRPDFDGIDFSASVRMGGASGAGAVAVEFVFPTNALVAYQDYDCTGQQLINLGFVLINGERVSLDLQSAESVTAQR
jgi:hypothetical protein